MDRNLTEAMLFASLAINAALLIFLPGVIRRIMNAMDASAFKNFLDLLVRSSKSPFMIIALNLPFIGAIPYYWVYGFGNWWLTAGMELCSVSGSVAKALKLPIYKAASIPCNGYTLQLHAMRNKMNMVNVLQSVCYIRQRRSRGIWAALKPSRKLMVRIF